MPNKPDIALFLASAVHDMKNSLGLLGSTLEKQVSEQATADVGADSADMLYEVKRINANLIHLLTLYKLGNELYPFDNAPHLVSEVFNDIVLQNKVLLKMRNVSLEMEVADDLVWHFDIDLINGVLGHALNNAINYTKDCVRLAAIEHDGWLELKVQDNGRGFPPSMLLAGRHLHGVDYTSGSTGLGLYFADHVARLHRNRERVGDIRLDNKGLEGGGCFTLTLP